MALSPPSGRMRKPLLAELLPASTLGPALAPLTIPPLRIAQPEVSQPVLLAPEPLTLPAQLPPAI